MKDLQKKVEALEEKIVALTEDVRMLKIREGTYAKRLDNIFSKEVAKYHDTELDYNVAAGKVWLPILAYTPVSALLNILGTAVPMDIVDQMQEYSVSKGSYDMHFELLRKIKEYGYGYDEVFLEAAIKAYGE